MVSIRSRVTREEKVDKTTTRGQEKKGDFEGEVYKKQNLTYIYPKKEKQLKTKTIRRVVLMSQSNDDEDERWTLLKRQKIQEDIIVRGIINPQQGETLLKKQHL